MLKVGLLAAISADQLALIQYGTKLSRSGYFSAESLSGCINFPNGIFILHFLILVPIISRTGNLYAHRY